MKNIVESISEISSVSGFQREYIEKNLPKILNIILVISLFIALISPFLFTTLISFYEALFVIISSLILKYVTKKGHFSLAGILTSFVLIFITNIALYMGLGFRDETILIFPGIIVLTSLIVNRSYFILFTAVSILNVITIGLLEIHGVFIHELSDHTSYGEVIVAGLLLIGLALGVYVLNSNLLTFSQRASQSEFQVRSFFNSNPEGIFLMDLDGIIKNANKSMLNLFNIDEKVIINKSFEEFLKEEDIPKIKKIVDDLKNGIANDKAIELDITNSQEQAIPVSIKGFLIRDPQSKPLALGAFVNDISEKKKLLKEKSSLEGQLNHMQKMEAIGTLAGGIAHDFNNILVGILGFTELAAAKEKDSKISSYLGKVQDAGNRAKGLVEQILKFSRRENGGFTPVSIKSIVNEVQKLLSSSLPSSVKIEKKIEIHKDIISGDETQVHQILMNICTNAYQAVKESGGTIKIHLSNQKVITDKQYLNMHIPPGDYIRICIEDNGIGMSPEITERIFEPYFTTKKVKEGTGLGLSVTLGIIQNHHGLIEVDSSQGKGTTFTIYLPEINKTPAKLKSKSTQSFTGNGEHIMILDDEFYFTDVMQGFLKGMNLKPTTFNDSLSALEHIKSHPDRYQCIISDLTMPEMNGLEFISEVRNINTDIPVILCSGFSEEVNEDTAAFYGISKFLNKPVSKNDIGNALNQILI